MRRNRTCFVLALLLLVPILSGIGHEKSQTPPATGPSVEAVLPDGRENPQVNRYGLSPEVLARPVTECSIVPGHPGRGNTNENLWPDGLVPFGFANNVSQENQQIAVAAMASISQAANVTFVPRTNEQDWVRFIDSGFNRSFVGPIGGRQDIEIFNWNIFGTVVHEILHALGMLHEHQRNDRNQFVTINFANINGNCDTGCQNVNFGIPNDAVDIGPYDYDSVMHYRATAFGGGNVTITPVANPPAGQFIDDPLIVLGQRNGLSIGDADSLRNLYGPPADAFVRFGSGGAQDGSFEDPFATLQQALNAVNDGDTIAIIGGGNAPGSITIDQDVRIISYNGTTVIGQ